MDKFTELKECEVKFKKEKALLHSLIGFLIYRGGLNTHANLQLADHFLEITENDTDRQKIAGMLHDARIAYLGSINTHPAT